MKDYYENSKTLYKCQFGKKVSGVCAGLGKYWDINPLFVRIAAIASLLMFPVPTAIAYIMAIILLPNKAQ
ncbi:PspC domain-containing protein [Alteromonadaceae bacterium BrNp21-10]|nr:PspC domain-containing protein [Alteromonadaceae bacterium BrNp21-10]